MNTRTSALVTSALFAIALSAACSQTRYEPEDLESADYEAAPVPAGATVPEPAQEQASDKADKSEASAAVGAPARARSPQVLFDRKDVEKKQSAPSPDDDQGVGDLAASEEDFGEVVGGVAGGVLGGLIGGNSGPMAGEAAKPVSTAQAPITELVTTGEDYTDYGVNDLVLTARDRLSTFSIDVDTASYSIARRKLESGALPPTASVRVEEFVNYFPYEYVGPTGEAPFAVNMEAAPNPFMPGHHVLRVGIQGRQPSESRAPVHLTFLVDTSGSMSSPDKLGLAQQSLHQLVENLRADDTVALATYAGSVRRVLEPTPIAEAGRVHAAIDDLSAGGSTAMSSGIGLAYQMAASTQEPGCENRVIVLSDGDANVGATSHEAILEQIRGYAQEGITLSTIGFGMGNYKDTLMEQLSNQGDGNYYYIDSQREARKVFGDDLAGTLEVIAKDVKIQIEFNPEAVMGYRLIGYENRDIADRDFRNDAVDAGEIGAGHRVTALYDLVLLDGYRAADDDGAGLATVRLRSKPPGPDAPAIEWETRFPARLLHDEFAEASGDFRLAFGAASFAELLRGSPYTAEITYGRVWEVVNDARRRGEDTHSELLTLIETAGRLSGESLTVAER